MGLINKRWLIGNRGTFITDLSTNSMTNVKRRDSPKECSDEQNLITLCQKGEVAALERLYRKYSKDVYNMALRMAGSQEIAEEVTQEVFISVFKDIRRFQFQSAFTTWLYKIVMRRCADYFRKNKRYQHFFVDIDQDEKEKPSIQIADSNKNPLDAAIESEKEKSIERAIISLSHKQRAILILRYVQHKTYEEIAEILNCSLGTVKSRLNRAHKSLEKILEERKIL